MWGRKGIDARVKKPRQEYLLDDDDDFGITRHSGYDSGFSYKYVPMAEKREALRGVISALAAEHKIKIELTEQDETPHADITADTIKVGTGDIWKYTNTDRYVGIALHEIGHIKHTPPHTDIPKKCSDIFNLLEDARIDEIMRGSYAGAGYYLDEFYTPTLEEIARYVESPSALAAPTIADALSQQSNSWTRADDIELENRYKLAAVKNGRTLAVQEAAAIEAGYRAERQNKEKRPLYMRTLGMAILESEGKLTALASTGVREIDSKIVPALASIIRQAKHARAEEIPKLTARAAQLLREILPEPEGGGHKDMTVRELMEALAGSKPPLHERKSGHYYTKADERARARTDIMRKKLIAYLRENDHARFHGGKRKGLLDKKAIHKVALKKYRVYKKREDTKNKAYAVSVVVDTSSSMFSYPRGRPVFMEIERALESAAILTRTFRSMGFPSSLVACGNEAKTVLDHRDRYVPAQIEQRMEQGYPHGYWQGGTEIRYGVDEALRRLVPVAKDKHKILVVITDGNMSHDDIQAIQHKIRKQGKSMSTFVYYVGGAREAGIVEESREVVVKNTSELPLLTAKLVKTIVLS